MGKYKRLTSIEIFLILAIIAVLVVWLFPRLLKTLDFNSSAIGAVKPYIGDALGTGGLNKLLTKDISQTGCCLSAFKVLGIDQSEPWSNVKPFGIDWIAILGKKFHIFYFPSSS